MEKGMGAYKAHCLVLPYPSQGHINPMLQFSKRLQQKGIKATFVTTRFWYKKIHKVLSGSIMIETISDGYDEGRVKHQDSFEAFWTRFQKISSETLAKLIEKLRGLRCPVDCIVYDSYLPWVLDVAKKLGLVGAAFFTQPCAVDNIYYHVHQGLLKFPLTGPKVLVPGLPPLEPLDMPSFLVDIESYPVEYEVIVNRLSNVNKADWILCNSFHSLEEEVVDWMAKLWRLRTIGPTIPSMYLDRRLEDDKEYGLYMFKPTIQACMQWLNERENGSVVYVSFGSLAELGIEQMEELAWGLRGSNNHFLWVVRASEESKLPANFMQEISEKGLMVPWCPQLEVLAHKAIGCFVTHCGWNSTLEALCLGVPMVAMPQEWDQTTNAKFVSDIWKIGLKAEPDEKGIVRKEVVESCLREIMVEEKGEEIRRNATKWRELAREAVDEGGSSDRNIDEFVAALVHS